MLSKESNASERFKFNFGVNMMAYDPQDWSFQNDNLIIVLLSAWKIHSIMGMEMKESDAEIW